MTDREQTRIFRGHYISAFESSAFNECGSKSGERDWWTEFAREARHPALDSAFAVQSHSHDAKHTDMFLEVQATLSRRGQYGHVGMSVRQLTVSAIRQAVPWTDSSCAEAARRGEGDK